MILLGGIIPHIRIFRTNQKVAENSRLPFFMLDSDLFRVPQAGVEPA